MQKPLSVSVTTASKLLIPAANPVSSDIGTWAAATDYVYGDIVRNNGILYWCVVAGTSDTTGPVGTSGDETDGTVTWRYLNQRREKLFIINDGAQVAYLAFGFAAEANKGIRLNSNGGNLSEGLSSDVRLIQGAIYAIAASGSINICIQEL